MRVLTMKALGEEIRRMRREGYKIGQICKQLHVGPKRVRRAIAGEPLGKAKSDSLCWACKNACGGCSWSGSFTPVKGWDADETMVDGNKSYLVRACPEFEEG